MSKHAPFRTAAGRAADDEHERQQVALIRALLLTVQHFFGGFSSLFAQVTDPRHPLYITYPLPAVLTAGVLLFLLRLGARRQVTLLLRQNGSCSRRKHSTSYPLLPKSLLSAQALFIAGEKNDKIAAT